jgi:ABC-type multidrug transport system fused ATPase/permease subunit
VSGMSKAAGQFRRLQARAVSSPKYGLAMILAALGIILLVVQLGTHPDPTARDGDSLYAWATACVVGGAVLMGIGVVALSTWDSRRRFVRGDRREQISRLTKSLEESLSAINAIRAEIEDGQEVLDKLEAETSRQEACG